MAVMTMTMIDGDYICRQCYQHHQLHDMPFFSFAGGTKGSESGGSQKVNFNTSAVAPEWWWKNEIKGEMGWNAAKIDPRGQWSKCPTWLSS